MSASVDAGGTGAAGIAYFEAVNDTFDGPIQGKLTMGLQTQPFSPAESSTKQASTTRRDRHRWNPSDRRSDAVGLRNDPVYDLIGFCTEADILLQGSSQLRTLRPQLTPPQYLQFKYNRAYDARLDAGGSAAIELAAVQALTWAWRSDPATGSTVFEGINPLHWDGLSPVAPSNPVNPTDALGFWSTHGVDQADLTPQLRLFTTLPSKQPTRPANGRSASPQTEQASPDG